MKTMIGLVGALMFTTIAHAEAVTERIRTSPGLPAFNCRDNGGNFLEQSPAGFKILNTLLPPYIADNQILFTKFTGVELKDLAGFSVDASGLEKGCVHLIAEDSIFKCSISGQAVNLLNKKGDVILKLEPFTDGVRFVNFEIDSGLTGFQTTLTITTVDDSGSTTVKRRFGPAFFDFERGGDCK